MLTAYIKSKGAMDCFEGTMHHLQFSMMETNDFYGVFTGNYPSNPSLFVSYIKKQLENTDFDVEDSVFITFSSNKEGKRITLSNIPVKRKGNKGLRE
jgi:hypothetical protein